MAFASYKTLQPSELLWVKKTCLNSNWLILNSKAVAAKEKEQCEFGSSYTEIIVSTCLEGF